MSKRVAAMHGASHQAPQVFQVITDRSYLVRKRDVGRTRLRFYSSKTVDQDPTTRITVPSGYVTVDELIIEFEKPSPFTQSTFRSRRPGTARPHRQLSGPAHKNAAGKRIRYTIRAINTFKTEMAVARPWVTVEV